MSRVQIILALDLATRIGWACWQKGTPPYYGSEVMPKCPLPGGGVDLGKFTHIYSGWLQEMISAYRVTHIAFEAPILPANTNIGTARKLYGLAILTERVGYALGLSYYEINNTTARKHFCGKGMAPRAEMKELIMAECRRRGFDPKNDDEADALCALDYAAWWLKLETDWPGRGAGPLFQTKEQVAARGRG